MSNWGFRFIIKVYQSRLDYLPQTNYKLTMNWKSVILVFILFFMGVLRVSAAEDPIGEMKANQTWTCLNAAKVGEASTQARPPTTATLKGTGVCAANTKCYLVTKTVDTEKGDCQKETKPDGRTINVCETVVRGTFYTTGTVAGDLALFGKDNTKQIPEAGKIIRRTTKKEFIKSVYAAEVADNSLSPGTASIDFMMANPDDHQAYFFYLAGINEELGQGSGAPEGDSNSQQLGTVGFEFPIPEGSKQDCTQIYWDPYGYVFDSVSYEPIKGAVVSLRAGGKIVDLPTNPAETDTWGKYNILVLNAGKYSVEADYLPSHEFVKTGFSMSKYSSIYLDSAESHSLVFSPGDPEFEESPAKPLRVDIPLKPKGTPYRREKIERLNQSSQVLTKSDGEYVRFEGTVDFPRAIIPFLVDGQPLTVDGEDVVAKSDRLGSWSIEIKLDSLPQESITVGEPYKDPELFSMVGNNGSLSRVVDMIVTFLIKPVAAQQSIRINDPAPTTTSTGVTQNYTFNPILRHIEGYAYDSLGKIIPKAKIIIKLKMNNSTVYETVADDSGFFTVYKNNLPPLEYYLEIVDPTTLKSSTQSTATFVKNNQAYIDSEKIDLMSVTKNDQPIVNPATGQLNQIAKVTPPQPAANTSASNQKLKSPIDIKLFTMILVLAVLLASTVGVIFYIRKSRPQI